MWQLSAPTSWWHIYHLSDSFLSCMPIHEAGIDKLQIFHQISALYYWDKMSIAGSSHEKKKKCTHRFSQNPERKNHWYLLTPDLSVVRTVHLLKFKTCKLYGNWYLPSLWSTLRSKHLTKGTCASIVCVTIDTNATIHTWWRSTFISRHFTHITSPTWKHDKYLFGSVDSGISTNVLLVSNILVVYLPDRSRCKTLLVPQCRFLRSCNGILLWHCTLLHLSHRMHLATK